MQTNTDTNQAFIRPCGWMQKVITLREQNIKINNSAEFGQDSSIRSSVALSAKGTQPHTHTHTYVDTYATQTLVNEVKKASDAW